MVLLFLKREEYFIDIDPVLCLNQLNFTYKLREPINLICLLQILASDAKVNLRSTKLFILDLYSEFRDQNCDC